MAANGLFIRFYIDESIFPDLADALRLRGCESRSAHEEGMLKKSDEEQLEFAAAGADAL